MTTEEMNRIYLERIQENKKRPCVGDYSVEELINHKLNIHAMLYNSNMLKELNVLDAVFNLAIEIRQETEELEKLYYDK